MKKSFFLSMAQKRKTTYEFSNTQVKDSDINIILEAARWAPSCSNHQPWSFIVIKNRKTIDRLMKVCSFGAFHTNPPAIIAITYEGCGDGETYVCAKPHTDDLLSIGQPSLNMIYAAFELGIGSAYLSPKSGEAEKILNVPKGKEVAILIGLGYERKGAFIPPHTRKKVKELTYYERYGGRK